jgi:hypothetical protein
MNIYIAPGLTPIIRKALILENKISKYPPSVRVKNPIEIEAWKERKKELKLRNRVKKIHVYHHNFYQRLTINC